MDTLSKPHIDIFIFSMWNVWTERNKVVWEGGACNPVNMVSWAMQLLEEFHCARSWVDSVN